MLKRLTIVILFLFLGMVCISDAKADNSSWMADLDQTALITQISIPGTHDSAAIESRCGGFYTCHTQTYNFTEQLNKGIRFFDIRLAYEDGDLEFHHSTFDLHVNFKAAIEVVKNHLTANPSESVIFLIKQEHSDVSADTFWARVSEQIADYPEELFLLDKSVPTVAEAKGKIIIMARNKSTVHPQGYHVNWADNTVHYEGHDSDLHYVVEDHYSLNKVGTDTKFAEIAQNLYLAGVCVTCGNPKTLFITFLSGEGDVLAKFPTHYAEYENPHTVDWLNDRTGPRPGVVLMDFAGDSNYDGDTLIDAVINQNRALNSGIYYRDASTNNWVQVDGAAVSIDVDSSGNPWVVNNAGKIFRRVGGVGGEWENINGYATDIGIGADDSVWVIGHSPHTDGNFSIYKWNGQSWDGVDGGAIRISVDSSGNPWVVNSADKIDQGTYNPTNKNVSWEHIPMLAFARDIGIGADNSVWVIAWSPKD